MFGRRPAQSALLSLPTDETVVFPKTEVRTLFALASVSTAGSFLLTGLVRSYAMRAGVLDRPSARSSHSIPTPRGGGLAILTAATIAIALGGIVKVVDLGDAITLGLGAWSLALLGWIDDHRSLRASTRLLVQFAVAGWTLFRFGGLPVASVGVWTLHLHWFGYLAGTLGLVWSINLFNFMDGIDALAGSQAALIFITVGLLLIGRGDASLGMASCILGTAAIGFLPWNWPPAKIFLGDVGSAPIGYLVAALAVAAENKGEVPLVVVALVSAVFIVDATVTLVRRLLRRERLSEAHRSHAYQRLARALGSHGRVSFWAAVETSVFAALGAVVVENPSLFLPAALFTLLIAGASVVYAEVRAPMDRESGSPPPVPPEILSSDGQPLVRR